MMPDYIGLANFIRWGLYIGFAIYVGLFVYAVAQCVRYLRRRHASTRY